MPDRLFLMMLGSPAIVQTQTGDVINSILTVTFLSGLGASGSVTTDPNELYKFVGQPIRFKFSSTQLGA